MGRKMFGTSIDEDIQTKFKEKCDRNPDKSIKMNDVLEALMTMYINEEFEIVKNVTFQLKKVKKD